MNNRITNADELMSALPFGNMMLPAVLRLTLKKKWFDMILSGEKKEEYREMKDYWTNRLMSKRSKINEDFKSFDLVCFKNGYQKDAPEIWVECKGITIGTARPEWSDNWQCLVFVIDLGKILSKPVSLFKS